MQRKMNPAAFQALVRGDWNNFNTAMTEGGIEAQKAQGQRQLNSSNLFPKRLMHGTTWEQLVELGFEPLCDADELFIHCNLPQGWKRQSTSHNMHSDILDEQGRKRVGVFYKAAFYDRRAGAYLNRRYRATVNPVGGWEQYNDNAPTWEWEEVIEDWDGTPVWTGERVALGHDRADYERKGKLEAHVREQIELLFPDYQNPMAYW